MIKMNSKVKRIAEKVINLLLNILIIIFGVILLISLYTGIQSKILGNEYANFFGYSMFEVQTGSMAEAINAGDCIIVKHTQSAKIKDIITYKQNSDFITHRVIEIYNGTYITKGDANSAKDEPIDQKQIVGKVVKILPNFGILRKTIFNPAVLITMIVTLLLFNFAFKKNKKEEIKKGEKLSIIPNAIIGSVKNVFQKIRKLIKDKLPKRSGDIFEEFEKNNNTTAPEVKVLEQHEEPQNIGLNKIKDENHVEEELSKTLLYRLISVDSLEVDDKFKEIAQKIVNEEPVAEENHPEEDIDKTSLYRIIPVDVSDIEKTRLEIAENAMTTGIKTDPAKGKIEEDVIEEVEEDEDLTKITLETLKNKRGNKKGKNIIDTALFIKKEEIDELIGLLFEEELGTNKRVAIKETLLNAYISAQYYNNYGDKSIEEYGRTAVSRIENFIKEVANKLINEYRGNDTKYQDKVNMYLKTFILIKNLEQAKNSIIDSKVKKEFYRKEIIKYDENWDEYRIETIVNTIIKIQKKYTKVLEYFLQNLETNMFNLNFNRLATRKDMYALQLTHNIEFSKVYSDYIIDKTYTEGIIAEDKMTILLTLLSIQIIKDMTSANFNRKYVLYIPSSLYIKEKKFDKILRMIDDDYAKENVVILTTYEELLHSTKLIKEVKKEGYKFALVFEQEVNIDIKNRSKLYIADYIFINKKSENSKSIISLIPEELLEKVIYEDIIDKIGDFGGEQE